jgi:hypothetical protein
VGRPKMLSASKAEIGIGAHRDDDALAESERAASSPGQDRFVSPHNRAVRLGSCCGKRGRICWTDSAVASS